MSPSISFAILPTTATATPTGSSTSTVDPGSSSRNSSGRWAPQDQSSECAATPRCSRLRHTGAEYVPDVVAALAELYRLPRTLAAQLRSVGLDDVPMTAHTVATTRLDPDSFAATVCQFVTHFVAGRCGLTEADVAAWMAKQRQLDERNEFFFACIQFCFTAPRPHSSSCRGLQKLTLTGDCRRPTVPARLDLVDKLRSC